jgi:ketosteroid isomerase-like protein
MNNGMAASQIRDLLSRQTTAIRERDIAKATENYSPEVVIFDVVGPLAYTDGSASVKVRLQQWLASFKEGATLQFEMVDLSVTAGETLAFSRSFNHVSSTLEKGGSLDMYWRETLTWEKLDGKWKITHAHSSVPFDPTTGKASTGLKPFAGGQGKSV